MRGLPRPRHGLRRGGLGGFYLEGRAGVVFVPDPELVDTTGELAAIGITQVEAELDTGFGIEGALGYTYDRALRGELSLGYRRNTLDGLSATSPGGAVTTEVEGDVSTFTVLANAYYDIDLGLEVVPFVGGGVGLAAIVFELEGADDADVVFAWQLGGGLAYELTANVAATVRYTYLATSDPEFEGIDTSYDSHNLLFGLRYRF